MVEKQRVDMSAAARKAWETRRKKYGPSGLGVKSKRQNERNEEKAGAESGGTSNFGAHMTQSNVSQKLKREKRKACRVKHVKAMQSLERKANC